MLSDIHNRHPILTNLALAAAAVGALSTTACGSDKAPPPPVVVTGVPGLPSGDCLPDTGANDTAATRCVEAMGKQGVIDLVLYKGVSTDLGDTIATQASHDLAIATHGLVVAKIKVVHASAAAQTALDKETCIDINTPKTYASRLADQSTPALHDANFVIAVSTKANCAGSPTGVADTDESGRDADVFLNNVRASAKIGKVDPTLEAALLVAHEGGHLMRLGHAGTVSFKIAGQSQPQSIDQLNPPVGSTIDLDTLFANGYVYSEYGGYYDLMGNPDPAVIGPNPIDRMALEWTQVVLDGKSSLAVLLGKKPSTITARQANTGEMSVIALPKALTLNKTLSKYEDPQVSMTSVFDRIAFVPEADPDSPNHEITNIGIYLYDSVGGQDTNVSLGGLTFSSGNISSKNQSWTVRYQGLDLKVTFNDQKLTVAPLN